MCSSKQVPREQQPQAQPETRERRADRPVLGAVSLREVAGASSRVATKAHGRAHDRAIGCAGGGAHADAN